ncbi:MAG: IS66 family insertion sequence element accessory protein TnpA [Cyclonatronaceae bacterium]
MFALVEQWNAGTSGQKEFCQEHNVKLSTFQYWIGKYRKSEQGSPGGFLELTHARSGQAEITYPNGVRISVSASDMAGIARLIHLW